MHMAFPVVAESAVATLPETNVGELIAAGALQIGQHVVALGAHYEFLPPEVFAEDMVYLPAHDTEDAFVRAREIGRCAPRAGHVVSLSDFYVYIQPAEEDGRRGVTAAVPLNTIAVSSHFGLPPTPEGEPPAMRPALARFEFFTTAAETTL